MESNDRSNQLLAELLTLYKICAPWCNAYGPINQLLHATQAAAFARMHHAPTSLVVATLLHDVGHVLPGPNHRASVEAALDQHEHVGHRWLCGFFGPEVTEPVRLHVQAKRYLCTLSPDYMEGLSPQAFGRLAPQGGTMNEREIASFRAEPYWREAVFLRQCDDVANDPEGPMPPFATFWSDIESCIRVNVAVAQPA
jgi:predicted HD phosphohydrolase